MNWLTNLFSPKRARKRSSPRRKSTKVTRRRKSPKRKTARSPRRKSTKVTRRRKSPKRKTARSPRRKSTKVTRRRKSPKSKTTRSPRRKSTKRIANKRGDALRTKIKSSDWFIVTMDGCGYCTEAKKILRSHGQKFKSLKLTDKNENKIWAVTDKLAKKKYRYFPMIFHKGKFFGGYGELHDKYK